MTDSSVRKPLPELRVVIADDGRTVRSALRRLLKRFPHIHVVGKAVNSVETIKLLHTLCPDLIMLEVCLPELDGLAVAQLIKSEHLNTRILFVTMYDEPEKVLEVLRTGATSLVYKDEITEDLATAIQAVLEGEIFVSPHMASRALQNLIAHRLVPVTS